MKTPWLAAGLFFATLSTLLLETLDARLLSVLTWYHLSFLAVSLAMLGMAAGAVYVFLHPERFSPAAAPQALAQLTFAFACAVPASHLLSLAMPFLPLNDVSVMEVVSIAGCTIVLAAPFAISGVAVTLALTRCGGPIGRLYAFDLVGAALGCVLVVPLLERSNISSAVFATGGAAAIAAVCFSQFAGRPGARRAVILAAALFFVAFANVQDEGLQIIYPKNKGLWLTNSYNAETHWNSHSYVLVQKAATDNVFLWGPGKGADKFKAMIAWLAIDGEAGTPVTQWDGNPDSLEWVSYDVTTMPYYLRPGGDIAVIGVGGGRDILSALWGHSRTITGIDVNKIMIDLHEGSHRAFSNIANQPNVTLVHDDGRAYITRSDRRFDVIQMSLVDTWAATGAGAFSLSENGLYTVDAWRVFLNHLTPGGVLSVSRWFDPSNVSETSRLLALGVDTLMDRGVARPLDQILLVVRDRVATLMISTTPFTAHDRDTVTAVAADKEFRVAASPWTPHAANDLLDRISRSTTPAELKAATTDPLFDYSPPSDARPYYFNMLKPNAIFHLDQLPKGGALGGNLRATLMLIILLAIATVLVALIIVWPLLRAGRPEMPGTAFANTMIYFAIIGFAFMLIQIGLLQRFSVYLGHPTYTLAIVLFAMLLFTGLGSLVSERVRLVSGGWFRFLPATIAAVLLVTVAIMPGVIARTVVDTLPVRTAFVLLFTAPLSMLLGMCFPFGVRLVRKTPAVVAWAWGVNGACGVLASIIAVAISIWVQIDANFWAAAVLYLGLTVPLVALARET